MPSITLSTSLPVQLLQQLTTVAEADGRPISWIVRDALIAHLCQASAMNTEEVAAPSESSSSGFDTELSLRLDQLVVLIESEPNAFWQYVLTRYRSVLEQAIPYGD